MPSDLIIAPSLGKSNEDLGSLFGKSYEVAEELLGRRPCSQLFT